MAIALGEFVIKAADVDRVLEYSVKDDVCSKTEAATCYKEKCGCHREK